jgi:hypothetical protein
MRRGEENTPLPKESLLKVDKDCFVEASLNGKYVRIVIDTCRKHGVTVLWIKSTETRHGIHFYIRIAPPVNADTANDLQYLLGDNPKRVDYNRARIESGLVRWNKLFERLNARLTTLYKAE